MAYHKIENNGVVPASYECLLVDMDVNHSDRVKKHKWRERFGRSAEWEGNDCRNFNRNRIGNLKTFDEKETHLPETDTN